MFFQTDRMQKYKAQFFEQEFGGPLIFAAIFVAIALTLWSLTISKYSRMLLQFAYCCLVLYCARISTRAFARFLFYFTIIFMSIYFLYQTASIYHYISNRQANLLTYCTLISNIFSMLVLFAASHRLTGIAIAGVAVEEPSAIDCLYLSIITWTTVGFGDIVPMGKGRIIAASEAIVGYLSMAGLIACFLKALE